MAKAYYSTIFDEPAGTVWAVIRDFNNYTVWAEGVGEGHIEDGKTGETIGANRNVLYEGRRIRQRLLAMSDLERAQTYELCDSAPTVARNYRATLRVTPVIDGNGAFVKWWTTFDCAPDELEKWTAFYRESFAKWLGSLRRSLQRDAAAG
jgi:hypothetical protein